MRVISLFICLAMGPLGCGGSGAGHIQPQGTEARGIVQLVGARAQSEIYLNDRYQGVYGQFERSRMVLTPGSYRLEVRTPGLYTWRGRIAVKPGNQRFDVAMLRVP